MKIVFSRKGWDSSAGGGPSPRVDGHPLTLPIPGRAGDPGTCYGDLAEPRPNLARDLQRWQTDAPCHLDPDIDPHAVQRRRAEGWRGAFGQTDRAAVHLHNQEVSPGDIFVFFGSFRDVVVGPRGTWHYHGRTEQCIWGWLEVGEILDFANHRDQSLEHHPWLAEHPHAAVRDWPLRNDVYVAPLESGLGLAAPYGTLARNAVLTADGKTARVWQAPEWLQQSELTYHEPESWRNGLLHTARRGQEFVASGFNADEALEWLRTTLNDGAEEADEAGE